MTDFAIRARGISKAYRLGTNSSTTLTESLEWLARRVLKRETASQQSDKLWALRDVSFDVAKGEIFGIVGRNGAGKSTLLKIISRITEPTQGRLEVDGRIGSLLEVGTGFHPELTGRENIFLNGTILGMRHEEIRRKFDEIVDFSGVERFIDTPVKRYSSGMYTKLAFAVAAHLETDILLVDEVLAVGDIQFQKKCLQKMQDVSLGGRTVLFVSHNTSAISRLCTRAIILQHGGIIADGAPRDVLGHYINSQEADSGINLDQRTDRSGAGNAHLTKLSFSSPRGDNLQALVLAEPIELWIEVAFPASEMGKTVSVSVHFSDRNEYRLFSFYSSIDGRITHVTGASMCFQCRLEQGLPVLPGLYVVDCVALINGVEADKVEHAVTLEILPADFYGSAELPHRSGGSVLLNYSWQVRETFLGKPPSTDLGATPPPSREEALNLADQ